MKLRFAVWTLAVSLLFSATTRAGTVTSLDADWRFTRGDPVGAQSPQFDAGSWSNVELPHDWMIDGPIAANNPTGAEGAFFPSGVGWYRKTFTPPAVWSGKHVTITFDGVYMLSDVWINGEKLGNHPYGYTPFTYDLTPQLKPGGANVIAVRVDNSKTMNSRWYSGSGIYRHVWIDAQDPLHIPRNGVYVTTQTQGAAPDFNTFVTVQTTLANDSDNNRTCKLETQLLNPDGKGVRADIKGGFASDGLPIESGSQNVEVPAHTQKTVEQKIRVPVARLWSTDTPNLYHAACSVSDAGKIIDTHDTTFGIRSVTVSADKGLLLNGQRILLCGGCVHHDNGPLGSAAFDRAEERRVQILKAAGFNAIRTSHNPPSPAFLDACDRLGILVIDELFDVWEQSKQTRQDYSVYFRDWSQRDLEAAVTRDRNHPSVFAWSIGNEIGDFGGAHGLAIGTALIDGVRKFDQTRLIDSSISNWNNAEALVAKLDFVGYNYQSNLYNRDHQRFPDRVMCATESYPSNVFNGWSQATDHTYVLGDFVWTAVDYLGESGIGRYYYPDQKNARQSGADQFPYHGASCGDLDMTGFRRPVSYYRNITWDHGEKLYTSITEPTPDGRSIRASGWALVPSHASWTWPTYEGKSLDVQVYSRFDSVRLYLNDKLIGEKPTTRNEQFKAIFSVSYAAGTLKTVGIQAGKEAQTTLLKTAGPISGLRLTPDRTILAADGEDLSFITVESVDANGNFQPNGAQPISFNVTGAATLAGVANGDFDNTDSYQAKTRKLFHGRALVIVRATHQAGSIEVRASSAGLPETLANINTR